MPARKSDRGNPEWTTEDFRRAKPASELPAEVLKVFPRTRGPQKAPTKVPVSIRLSPEVLDHFKSTGKGWQALINETLAKVAHDSKSKRHVVANDRAPKRTKKTG